MTTVDSRTPTIHPQPRFKKTIKKIFVILSFSAPSGSTLSLDLREQFGERVELECFHFVVPPIEFRLVRDGSPLQEWQAGNAEMYDLQHSPAIKQWGRDGHWFVMT